MSIYGNLVNKQFNTPINLYSKANIDDALQKQSQVLANGAVGIDFHNLAKPGNLANSAVLRMLEEEERSGRGQGLKRVTWPPPPEDNEDSAALAGATSPPVSIYDEPIYHQGQTQLGSQPPATFRQAPPSPPTLRQAAASPPGFRQAPPSPKSGRRADGFHPVYFEPPKTTVTLRATPPISQEPHLVYQAQPITASVQGGANMRGDQKWPPESVKQQTEAENAARIALAKGPACRPRKVKKDYSEFFAQHALNSTYPGYRAPPGTQHYMEGTSDL